MIEGVISPALHHLISMLFDQIILILEKTKYWPIDHICNQTIWKHICDLVLIIYLTEINRHNLYILYVNYVHYNWKWQWFKVEECDTNI